MIERSDSIRPWEILTSRYEVDDEWLRLRVDRCRIANGRIIDPFYVFEVSDWVIVLPVTSNGQVPLVRQYRHAKARVALELPGGMMSSEEDPLIAAQRELREETGYEAPTWIRLPDSCANPDTHANTAHLFLAMDARRVGAQELDATEHMEVELVPIGRVHEMAMAGELDQSLHLAALLLSRPHLRHFGV